MADRWAIWHLGALENEVSRIGEKSGHKGIAAWDAACAAGLTAACLLSYEAITFGMADLLSRSNDFLGGMWTVVATVFVFRNAGAGGLTAGLERFVATCVSILLCFLYLLVFPFTAVGLACLVGLGVLCLALVNQREDIVTTSITTTVVMVVAGLSPEHAWQQPLLRLLDTVVGVAVGIACKWVVLLVFLRVFGGPQEPLGAGATPDRSGKATRNLPRPSSSGN